MSYSSLHNLTNLKNDSRAIFTCRWFQLQICFFFNGGHRWRVRRLDYFFRFLWFRWWKRSLVWKQLVSLLQQVLKTPKHLKHNIAIIKSHYLQGLKILLSARNKMDIVTNQLPLHTNQTDN